MYPRFVTYHISAAISTTQPGSAFLDNRADGTLSAITVVGNYTYVTASRSDAVYRGDINSGVSEVFGQGLSNPEDIEYVPFATVPNIP